MCIRDRFYKEDLRNSKRGAAIPHLNKELFYNLPIGIPPYQAVSYTHLVSFSSSVLPKGVQKMNLRYLFRYGLVPAHLRCV